jgi:Malectin domain
LVEGTTVVGNFDIFRDAPGKLTPEIVTTNTYVTDGTITIDFTAITSDPSINGIEIIYSTITPSAPVSAPVTSPVTPPTAGTGNLVYRINSGSSNQVIVPPNNIVWDSDQFVLTGLPYNNCNNRTGSIYCSGRYFQSAYGTPFRYDIPIPISNRTYQVRLHFAESVRVL